MVFWSSFSYPFGVSDMTSLVVVINQLSCVVGVLFISIVTAIVVVDVVGSMTEDGLSAIRSILG